MPTHERPPPDKPVEQAVDWFVRHDAGPLSVQEQAAFDDWLAAAPAHRDAFAEIERLWSELDAVPADAVTIETVSANTVPADRVSRDRQPPKRAARRLKGQGHSLPARSAKIRRRAWAVSVGGSAIAGLCLAVMLWLDLPMRLQADALSGVGQMETITLPDGSTAVLNTDSALAIDFTATERRVTLLRGEAEFTVVADPGTEPSGRPFRVDTGAGVSTALGTIFLARRLDGRTTITVLESRVEVAYGAPPAFQERAVLERNQQISYDAEHGLGPVRQVDPLEAAAWRQGKLMFVDQTLGTVIDALNRYHVGRILIADADLGRIRVSGVFETEEPVAVVDALEASLGLRSTRLTDLLIVLHQ